MPFSASSIDVVICANVLHHFAAPTKFLSDLYRCLKHGGHDLLFEPNPSLLFLLALRMMRHEGWSFDVDVFDPMALVNDPTDPWSGDQLSHVPDPKVFRENAPGFEILHDSFTECLMFPLSGGVTAKTKTIKFPTSVLKLIDWLDRKSTGSTVNCAVCRQNLCDG